MHRDGEVNTLMQKRLKEMLQYNPVTGDFVWRVRAGIAGKGRIAGYCDSFGYVVIHLDYKAYKAHRLAFLYVTGSMPDQVDHTNHIRSDNAWSNLEASSNKLNGLNQSLFSTNTSGFCGVVFNKRDKIWSARIKVAGRQIALGTFKSKSNAIAARATANRKYGSHDNHGLKK